MSDHKHTSEAASSDTDRMDPQGERWQKLCAAADLPLRPSEALQRRVTALAAQSMPESPRAARRWSFLGVRWAVPAGAAAIALLLSIFGTMLARHYRGSASDHGAPVVTQKLPSEQPKTDPTPIPRNDPVAPKRRMAERSPTPWRAPRQTALGGSSLPANAGGGGGDRQRAVSASIQRQRPDSPLARRREGDLNYLNLPAVGAVQRWTTLSTDEWDRIEAQVRGSVRVRDDFVQIPFPRVAASSGRPVTQAIESYKREAAIVDSRLFRKLTLELKGASLEELCAALQAQTGVQLHAARGVADDKVTVFVKERPAREVMRAIVQLFGYTWSRSKKEDRYQYELVQDLKSQLAEEELRNRDMSAALLALDREVQAYRPYLSVSVDELKARFQRATGEEKERLQRLVHMGGWVGIQLYQRLTSAERAAMLNGRPLVFSPDASHPDRRLPSDWIQPTLRSYGPVEQPDGGATPLAEVPGLTLSAVSLDLNRSDLGRVALGVTINTAMHGRDSRYGEPQMWTLLAHGLGPSRTKADNATANQDLRRQSLFQEAVSIRPNSSCRWSKKPDPEGRAPHVFSADVWEAVHRETGVSIVADFYTHISPSFRLSNKRAPLFDVLNQIGEAMDVRWQQQGDFLLCRSTHFFWDRLKEIPKRYLERWQREKREQGGLTLESLIEMASLSDEQLNAGSAVDTLMHCLGLEEIHLVGTSHEHNASIPYVEVRKYTNVEPWLWRETLYPGDLRAEVRFLGALTPEQRRRVLQPDGLAFSDFTPDQQRRLLQLWNRLEEIRERQGHSSGLNPQVLAGTRFSAEYIPAGWHHWNPLYVHEPQPRVLPRVAGRSMEDALAAARRIDPAARPEQIGRSRYGDFVPSIWMGAIPMRGDGR